MALLNTRHLHLALVTYYWRGVYRPHILDLLGLLVFVGDLLILSASFYIAGLFYHFDNIPNDTGLILAPFAILFSFLLYIPFKNKSLIFLSVLFLLIYLSDLISKFSYLFGSLGWPFVLIITGILFMLIGYALVHKQKK